MLKFKDIKILKMLTNKIEKNTGMFKMNYVKSIEYEMLQL